MTPNSVVLVQDRFRHIAMQSDRIADLFYANLFAADPSTRALFPADMLDQKRKLMKTLGVAIQNLHQADAITSVVRELGARHATYGVRFDHYEAVGEALLKALREALGKAWTPELEKAWRETYEMVGRVMKEGAAMPPAKEKKKSFLDRILG